MPAYVDAIKFVNEKGELFPLRQFATIKQSCGQSMLEQKDWLTSVTIKSNVSYTKP